MQIQFWHISKFQNKILSLVHLLIQYKFLQILLDISSNLNQLFVIYIFFIIVKFVYKKICVNLFILIFSDKLQIRMFKKANMQYRKLGNTGLFVSVLSYGNYNSHEVVPFQQQVQIVKTLFSNGVNFIDTAPIYTNGLDEEDLGKVLKEVNEPRENYVISTKIWRQPNPSLNSTSNTNRKNVKQNLHSALKRLQLDYVDIVYAHSYDYNTPIQETCRAFHEVIQQGLAFYWGTSNWDADKVYEAFQICEKYNLHKPVATQTQYNMINRKQVQEEYRTLLQNYHFGLAAFSPLLGGILTGKYLDNQQVVGRLAQEKTGICTKQLAQKLWSYGFDKQKTNQKLRELREITQKELGCDLTSLAIAWVLKFPHTSTAIFGARNVQQVEKCIKSIQVVNKINKDLEGRINKILQTHPNARMEWKSFTSSPHFRPLAQ